MSLLLIPLFFLTLMRPRRRLFILFFILFLLLFFFKFFFEILRFFFTGLRLTLRRLTDLARECARLRFLAPFPDKT